MGIEQLKDRLKSLSPRERIFLFITSFIVVVVVPYLFLYSSSSKKLEAVKLELNNLKIETGSLQTAISSVPGQQAETETHIVLPDTEDLAGMLAAITREANLANVEFVSLIPEGITHKDSYMEMKVKIESRVRFRSLYDFLRNMEMRQRLFVIRNVKFETNDALYPSGIALINAVVYLRKK